MTLTELFTNIANAIRNKTGSTAEISATEFPDHIAEIQTGVELPELTNEGTAADLLSGKQLIDSDGEIITGTIDTATQATPSITVSYGGLITASATQSAGYVSSGTKSATKQLTTDAGGTITPGTTQQVVIEPGVYTTGTYYVKGDSNLIPANIVSGKSIFGVSGSAASDEIVTEYVTTATYSLNSSSTTVTISIPTSKQASEVLCIFGRVVYSTNSYGPPAYTYVINYPGDLMSNSSYKNALSYVVVNGVMYTVSNTIEYNGYPIISGNNVTMVITSLSSYVSYLPPSATGTQFTIMYK